VLDVRSEREYDAGHISGALHIHGGLLQERVDQVPRDREVAVVCGSGYRASIAASVLKRRGYTRVTNVLGGMSGYLAAGYPAETGEPTDRTPA
jgi:hydroxyacylglutathione hydrolase